MSVARSVKIDLPARTEKRYIIPSAVEFLGRISSYVERMRFSDNEHVQTIYFNNDEHVVPFDLSIKARKYLPSYTSFPVVDGDEKYFLDLKSGGGDDKKKERFEGTLEMIVGLVNEKYHFSETPLRPYVAVEYSRCHYIPKDMEGARLTIDADLRYFFFPHRQEKAVEIGKESDFARIEVKEEKSRKDFSGLMDGILKELHAFPVISKKFMAYNLLGLYRGKIAGKPFHKEFKDYEIESKSEAESEDVFRGARRLFEDCASNFKLPAHFPYTFESASINRYYKNGEGLFKAMLRGNEVEIVKKGATEIVRDPHDLNCILKRPEKKGMFVPIDSEVIASAELRGELRRARKAFWVENQRTGRFYHISLDRCLSSNGTLYQMEVEYSGRYGGPEDAVANGISESNVEREIIGDISDITLLLHKRFPSLKPSQLTKYGWLGIE